MQETWVRSLVRDDPTCCGAPESVATTTERLLCNRQAGIPEPSCCAYWSLCACSPCLATREGPTVRGPCTATGEWPCSPTLGKNLCGAAKAQRSQDFNNFLIKKLKHLFLYKKDPTKDKPGISH